MKASAFRARSLFWALHFAIIAMSGLLGPVFGASPIRIMPVGDSITQGAGAPGGYRWPLYVLLTAAGFNVDFVGTLQDNPFFALPDPDHEGHSGYRIDQIDSGLLGYFEQISEPDVILLLIGTNDYGQEYATFQAINRLEALVAKMATLRPFAKIIVANLLVRGEPYNSAIQQTFNPYVPGMVARQAALGRQVYFTDLRSAVPLSDLPDMLHPGELGYQKMATNWFNAITSLFSPEGSTNPPAVLHAYGVVGLTNILVSFSKPVADDATNATHYSVSGGVTVGRGVLDQVTKRDVTLSTTVQVPSSPYILSVNGVRDRTSRHTLIETNSSIPFLSSGTGGRGVFDNVPEAAGYELVYSLDIPNAPSYPVSVRYDLDLHTNVTSFSRVAYYLELQVRNRPLNFLWVSMDAFTTDVTKIGVPTTATHFVGQRHVARMHVLSSQAGIVSGSNFIGNIEFWPMNYLPANSAGVPNANDFTYDWGDMPTAGNYGSMQVHVYNQSQVLFAFNRWGGAGGIADLGIGTRPIPPGGGDPDWTFAQNANSYSVKTLQVLVNKLPVAQCKDVIVSADTNCVANASVDEGSFNPDGDPFTVSQFPPGPYPIGTNLVTLVVTDGHGASNSCLAQLVVRDTTPPTVVCPSDVAVEFTDLEGAAVSFAAPQASDLCSLPVTVVCQPPSGSVFRIGTTEVHCTATDAAGNGTNCSFQITVLGAQGVKSNVLSGLIELQGTLGGPGLLKDLDEAITRLGASLRTGLWIDETHITLSTGDLVFSEEKGAVHALESLLAHPKAHKLAETDYQQFIDRIVKADRLLALIAIRDAEHAGLTPQPLAEARREVTRGDGEESRGQYEAAIDHYRNAWRRASSLLVNLAGRVDVKGRLRLEFTGLPGETYGVETSTNLLDWASLGIVSTGPDGAGRFEAHPNNNIRFQFYRLKHLP